MGWLLKPLSAAIVMTAFICIGAGGLRLARLGMNHSTLAECLGAPMVEYQMDTVPIVFAGCLDDHRVLKAIENAKSEWNKTGKLGWDELRAGPLQTGASEAVSNEEMAAMRTAAEALAAKELVREYARRRDTDRNMGRIIFLLGLVLLFTWGILQMFSPKRKRPAR